MPELDLNYQANTYAGMVGKSRLMHERVLSVIDRVATTDITVLILGETGTGKELAARAIHNNSMRRGNPYVTINCAAIPKDLIESELYGHTKGSFTGAVDSRSGKFREADSGTLFMDEIGGMPIDQQPKLLRVLEDMLITPVGSDKGNRVDVRVIAATNQNLYQELRDRTFRYDLYHRLAAMVIKIPPLRERIGDIPMLINYFMRKYQERYQRTVREFTPREYLAYMDFTWPGNVRELENAVKGIVSADIDKLETLEDLKNTDLLIHGIGLPEELKSALRGKTWKEVERDMVIDALRKFGGNQTLAGKAIGMNRDQMRYRIRKMKRELGIDAEFQPDGGKVVQFKKS